MMPGTMFATGAAVEIVRPLSSIQNNWQLSYL